MRHDKLQLFLEVIQGSSNRGTQCGVGKKFLINYLKGRKLTRAKQIAAKHYECMFNNDMIKMDCKDLTCPLYDSQPYRKGKK